MGVSILLKNAQELSVQDHAQLFCDALNLNDYDARAHISRNPQGIIACGIEADAAALLKNSLDEQGFPAIITPDEMINSLDLKSVKIASISDTVYLEDLFGNGVHLSFSDLSAVAVSMNIGTAKNTPLEREFLLDLIFSDGTVLRFNSKKFNYGYLEERKSHSVLQNFILLLNDIEERVSDTLIKDEGYSLALAQQFEKISAPKNERLWNQYVLWLSHSHILSTDGLEVSQYEKAEEVQPINVTEIRESEDHMEEATEVEIQEINELKEAEPVELDKTPVLQEISHKELNKQIRAVCKALENGRFPEDIASKMIEKGIAPKNAEVITQVLNSFNRIGEDEDKKLWVLEQNNVPDEFHSNFLNIVKKVNNDELLEKLRNKQGISKEARRKGAIKTGRIAMLIISVIFFLSAFIHWKGTDNTVKKYSQQLNQRYGSYASERMKSTAEYSDMQFRLKMMTTASISFGIAFLLLSLYTGFNPYQSCRLGFLFFACLIAYEIYLYRALILFNFTGHIIKVFGITSLFYAYNAAKKQKSDTAPESA